MGGWKTVCWPGPPGGGQAAGAGRGRGRVAGAGRGRGQVDGAGQGRGSKEVECRAGWKGQTGFSCWASKGQE